jgi:polysaccharide export outer membrane protein
MHRKLLLLSLILSGCATLSLAQDSLLIGAGDKLHVRVFDTPEMEQHPQVTDSGTVPLMLLGNVKVAGLTPAQAAAAIQEALVQKQIMMHPQVEVTIDEHEGGEVAIMGQVKDPGSYEIAAPMPILKVLALAGGLNDLADRHVTVEHHNGPATKQVYFLSNDSKEALDGSFTVYPGDTVLVPKAGLVYILGDVAKPGGYPIGTNDSKLTIMQALSLAGSPNKTALLGKAKLIRHTASGDEDVPIKLVAIQEGKQPDIALLPDDKLFIPFSWMKNIALSGSSIAASATSAAIYAKP